MRNVESFIAECRLAVASTDSVAVVCGLSSSGVQALECTGSVAEVAVSSLAVPHSPWACGLSGRGAQA